MGVAEAAAAAARPSPPGPSRRGRRSARRSRRRSRCPAGRPASGRRPPCHCRRARVPPPPVVALKWCLNWKSRRVVCPGSRGWIEPPRPSPPSGPPRGTWASRRKVEAPAPPSPARTQIFTRSSIPPHLRMARHGPNVGLAVQWVARRPDVDAATSCGLSETETEALRAARSEIRGSRGRGRRTGQGPLRRRIRNARQVDPVRAALPGRRSRPRSGRADPSPSRWTRRDQCAGPWPRTGRTRPRPRTCGGGRCRSRCRG